MSKRGSYKAVAAKNAPIVDAIRRIKADHPFWGYRRVWARLNYGKDIKVSKNRDLRLMQQHNLLVSKDTKLRAKRMPDNISCYTAPIFKIG